MNTKINLMLLIMLILAGSLLVFSFQSDMDSIKRMKQINVLKDSKDDLRKKFGEPAESSEFYDSFALEDGSLLVIYSQGKCVQSLNAGKWDVSKDIVNEAEYSPNEDIIFNELNLNLNGFKVIQPDDDVPSIFAYRNEKLGIEYIRQKNSKTDLLTDVRIFPSNSKSSLRCNN